MNKITKNTLLYIYIYIAGTTSCLAEYVATGPFEGEVCTGIISKSCSLVRVDAIKTYDGFVEINKNWDSVDDFNRFKNSNEGRCYKYFTGVILLSNVLVVFADFHRCSTIFVYFH